MALRGPSAHGRRGRFVYRASSPLDGSAAAVTRAPEIVLDGTRRRLETAVAAPPRWRSGRRFAILSPQRKEDGVGRTDEYDDGDDAGENWPGGGGDGEEWKGRRRERPVPGERSPGPEEGGVEPPSADGPSPPGRRSRAASPETAAAQALSTLRLFLDSFPPEPHGEPGDPLPLERVFRASRRSFRLYVKAVFRTRPGHQPHVEFEEPRVRLTATGGRLFDLELAACGGQWGLMEEDLALREIFHRLRHFPFFLGL